MIGLLPIARVIAFVAVVYAAVIVGVVMMRQEAGFLANFSLALSGATILQLTLLAWIYFGWRGLWSRIPWLGRALFPDIDGEWTMVIHWQGPGRSGQLEALAVIKQTFVTLSMEVHSAGSDSITLIAQPRRDPESSRPILYYVYQVSPKAIGSDAIGPYNGAAILRYHGEGEEQLRGNYWTSQKTTGHFVLTRRTAGNSST